MGRFGSRIILLAVLGSLPAAENGYGGEVFLSITRKTATVTGYEEPAERVPARIDVITKEEIGRMPAHKADEVLKNITGATAIRTNGIYSVRPLVTLRGLSGEEQGRTLILKDGVPLNISDTGDVNWNSINLDEVERIEVFKGPGSSLYGSNAMGGVINIITLKPAKILEGRVSGEYGTYDTVSNKLFLAGRQYEKPAGLYWRLSGFVQNSGGYVSAPDNLRTPYSVARYLREKDGGARIGYDFNAARSIEAEYAYYTDARGEGTKILAGDGQYRDFSTANSRVRYKDRIGGTSLDVTAYSQLQKYARLSETLKGASYARFDGASDREDDGLLVQAVRRLNRANTLTGGVNARRSAIRGADCYRTSPDIVENGGALDMYVAYVQEELDTLQERLKVLAGLRYDYVRFYGGYYRVRNPSSATSAWTAYNTDTFTDNAWSALTPRLSARYFLNERVSAYASYARGFRASILDDLCRSGYLWPGPKVANPSIGPENIDTYEIGGTIASIPRMEILPVVYYSRGHQFLYYVATDLPRINNRTVYRRENVGEVELYGTELDLRWSPIQTVAVGAGYAFNMSKILRFAQKPLLENKELTYNPIHQAHLTGNWRHRTFNAAVSFNYTGSQYMSEDNTGSAGEYCTTDIKLAGDIYRNTTVSVGVENIFDTRFRESTTDMSPGRIIESEVCVRF